MKPSGPVARRADYTVRDCPLHEAARFIEAHHYARGCAKTAVYVHGLYSRGGALVGAALWMPPTKVCAQSVHAQWRGVLSLSRLAVAPTEPKNAASLLIGGSIRLIRAAGKWIALVTYADQALGHTGKIYRATNWHYVGLTKPKARWLTADGRQVSCKAGPKTRTRAEMEALGHVCAGSSRKHKFTMLFKEPQ